MSVPAASRWPVIFLLFFLSGAVGVAYEVVWTRQLSLLFGVSIYAVSAVLVAFMGGLGAGAEYFGGKLDRGLSPIRLYASLEIALGVYVLAFPIVFAAVEKAYLLLHPGYEGVSVYVIAMRLALAAMALIVPTTLMGGTLPALAKYFSKSGHGAGRFTGALYAINTIGAMAGCVAAGFWMIENLGLTNTLRAGAVINIAVGALAWLLEAEPEWHATPLKEDIRAGRKKKAKAGAPGGWDVSLLVLFGVSGFCALALEVLWTRLLVLLLNNTTYAFSLILAIFLLGIGVGSAAASRVTTRASGKGAALFAAFQMGVGAFALLSIIGFSANQPLTELINAFITEKGWLAAAIPGGAPMAVAITFALVIVFPCTFMMGGGFPLVVEAVTSGGEKVGGEVGRLYAANIIGCVLGSLLAGYAMIPLWGIQKSVITVSWIAIISGVYLLCARSPKFRAAALVTAAGALAPLTAAIVYKGDVAFFLNAQKLDPGSEVEFYEEGPSATVLVSRQESDLTAGRKPIKRIWINGDPIAGVFREALQLERLQAYIPLLLHPDPKNALVICFGTGSTAGAAAASGLESVIAVDISKEVFNAGSWFSAGNHDVMSSPALELVEEDGRNYLLTTKRTFDFITSEPPPPSNAGIVSLYTKEYYELCKKRLKDGGVVSQWIPLHHLSEEDFRSLVASFVEVFPHVDMWYTKWDAIMIGSNTKMPINAALLRERMKTPAIAESLMEIGITSDRHLIANYMMGKEQLAGFVGSARPLGDDRPVVEFTAPRIHAQGVAIKGANLAAMLKHRTLPEAEFPTEEESRAFRRYFESEGFFLRGQIELNDNNKGKAAAYFAKALEIDEDNVNARYALLSLNISTLYSVMSGGKADLGLKMLEDTIRLDRDGLFRPQTHFLRGMFFAQLNMADEAEKDLREAVRLDGEYFMAMANLAGLYNSVLNQPQKAIELYERALKLKSSENERRAIISALDSLKG